MTELRLSAIKSDVEFCYTKQNGAWLLYDDSSLPRQHIATITGSDLDGWTWAAEVDILRGYFEHEQERAGRWKAALTSAAQSYTTALLITN